MSELIYFIDRKTGETKTEQVYGQHLLSFLYENNGWVSRFFGHLLAFFSAHCSFCSRFYGFLQRLPYSKKKILPFIKKYGGNPSEFLDPIESFKSFDAFFTRKLKPRARPITSGDEVAIIPADGRYLFYPRIDLVDGFLVKGEKFSLLTLLKDSALANEYAQGSLVIARLAPPDYHRFHFPLSSLPSSPRLIRGPLYSVNPVAVKRNIHIFSKNKRMVTELVSQNFGKVISIEVGATNVGSIHQTFKAHHPVSKGEEKGYFSFGGSAILLLFQPGKIEFDRDLLTAVEKKIEIYCELGQSMGRTLF